MKTALLKEYPDIHRQVLHLMKLARKKERANDNSNRTKKLNGTSANVTGNPRRSKEQIGTSNATGNPKRTKEQIGTSNAKRNPSRTKKQITSANFKRTKKQIATSNDHRTETQKRAKNAAETIQQLMDFRTQMTSSLANWPECMLQDHSLDIAGESCLEGDVIDMLMAQKFQSKVNHAALVKCVCAVCWELL